LESWSLKFEPSFSRKAAFLLEKTRLAQHVKFAEGPFQSYKKEILFQSALEVFAAVGSTLFLTTDFDVMTRASFLDRVITMQLDSKYRRNLVFCQSVIARKSP
jgi:hypothetical protein